MPTIPENFLGCVMGLLLRLRSFALLALIAVVSVSGQNAVDLKPSPQQSEWQDLEMGAIIHFRSEYFPRSRMGRWYCRSENIQSHAVRSGTMDAGAPVCGREVCDLRCQASRWILPLADSADRLQR